MNASGNYLVTPAIILSNPTCDPNDFLLEIKDASNNTIGNLLNCTHIGQSFTATVTNIYDENSCWGSITLVDNLGPTLQCQDTFLFCFENADPETIGFPPVFDNCTSLSLDDLNYTDIFTDLPCFSIENGDTITAKIERTWTATDAFGNSTNCTQNIYFKRVTVNDIVFPINKDDFEAPALDCNGDPTNLALTGKPTINGTPVTSDGLCELAVTYTDQIFGICSPAGYKIIRTWTAVDWCSSDFVLDAQVIKVMDKTAPAIVCPNDLTVSTSTTTCSATVTLPEASASDDCSGVNITAAWQFGTGFGPFQMYLRELMKLHTLQRMIVGIRVPAQ